jgi:large subunit ribosomal protein L3
MPSGLIGRKIGMTQMFDDAGNMVPLTLIEAGPCRVLQIKTVETDGYSALQLGFGKKKSAKKPTEGHLKKTNSSPVKVIREVGVPEEAEFKPGDELKVSMFEIGEEVDVIGDSKGRGFQGVMRRHNFKGGKQTHGSMFKRAPGSIGMSATPSRVFKGKKMPGQMGAKRNTVRNLPVVSLDEKSNLIGIRGAVPGPVGNIVIIRKKK